MASQEKRIQELEQQVDKLYQLFKLPAKTSIVGNELIPIYTPSGQLARYPYADVIASGSIDPSNDIKQVFVHVPNIDFSLNIETQIASFIDAQPKFSKSGSEIYYFVATRIVLNDAFDSGFQTIRDLYWLSYPKGDFGAGQDKVATERLVKQATILDNDSNIQTINYSATTPYTIENIVNTGTVFTPIESATIIFEVDVDSGASTDYYLYQGPVNADIGTGEYQIQVGETRYLNTASPDLYNPIQIQTGWESKFEATTQSLIAGDNLITITGTSESNGGLTLLDSNGKIEPIQQGDSMSVDFGCTVVTPSTTNQWVKIFFDVNGTNYRAITTPLKKGSGDDHEISLSANLPVGSDFALNGLEVYIEASTAVDIKNKYIMAERNHINK